MKMKKINIKLKQGVEILKLSTISVRGQCSSGIGNLCRVCLSFDFLAENIFKTFGFPICSLSYTTFIFTTTNPSNHIGGGDGILMIKVRFRL